MKNEKNFDVEAKVVRALALSKCLSKMVIPEVVERGSACRGHNDPTKLSNIELYEAVSALSEILSEELDEIYELVS